MTVFETHVVEVFLKGEPTYIVDVPSALGPEAACRRAHIAILSQHPNLDFDDVTVNIYNEED